jgi:hypothetical protein
MLKTLLHKSIPQSTETGHLGLTPNERNMTNDALHTLNLPQTLTRATKGTFKISYRITTSNYIIQ